MFTRDDYMQKKCSHREFYAQFVTTSLRDLVRSRIGEVAIKASIDDHLNDIPLCRWDAMQNLIIPRIHTVHKQMGYSGGASLSDCVCVAKEAAKQIKEGQ